MTSSNGTDAGHRQGRWLEIGEARHEAGGRTAAGPQHVEEAS